MLLYFLKTSTHPLKHRRFYQLSETSDRNFYVIWTINLDFVSLESDQKTLMIVVIVVLSQCTHGTERNIINILRFVVLVLTLVPASRDMTYERQRLDFADFRSK